MTTPLGPATTGRVSKTPALVLMLSACALFACGPDAPSAPAAIRSTGSVEGQVMANDSTRVAQATLTLTAGGTGLTASTDAGGVYVFQTVVPATWTLELTLPSGWALAGTEAATRVVVVRAEQTTREDFVIMRDVP